MKFGYARHPLPRHIKRQNAARLLQRRWRKRKAVNKPAQVKRIVRDMAPTRGDVFFPVGTMSQAPQTLNNLSNIVFNDDPSNFGTRQSLKIKLSTFNFRGSIEMPTGTGTNLNSKVRLLVVRKKVQDQIAFDPRRIFYNHPGVGITNYYQYQIDKRYCTPLYDKTFQLQNPDQSNLVAPIQAGGSTATYPWKVNLDMHVPLKGDAVTRFAETPNATQTQSLNNQFYLVTCSDTTLNPPVIGGTAVVWFKNID